MFLRFGEPLNEKFWGDESIMIENENIEDDEWIIKRKKIKIKKNINSGIVTKWFIKKGYGFIKNTNNESIFCHQKDIVKSGFRFFKEGSKVSFEVLRKNNKNIAINVKSI